MTHNVEVKNHAEENMTGARVVVIGAGTMGAAVARRLLAAGATVDVWNRGPEPTHALAGIGARVHADPHDAVRGAPLVLTLLPTGDAPRDVMVGRGVVDAMGCSAAARSGWAQQEPAPG